MNRKALFGLLLMIMLITTGVPLVVDGGTSGARDPVDDPVTDDPGTGNVLESAEPFVDVRDLAASGIGVHRTIDIADPDNIMASVYNLDWLEERRSNRIFDSPLADETDDMDNPFYAEDGDEISNNVSSTISSNQITFVDEDYYQINLTSDGPNATVEKLEIVITSTEAEEKNASLTVEVLHVNFLLGQWMDGGFESVGKFHGNSTKMVYVPDGDVSLNFQYPLMFRFRSWNHTMLNFTFKVEISSTTRTEWNGLLGGGPVYNSTNRPARMQSINRSHDYYDWFDLSGTITDNGLDTNRGDNVKYSLRVDIATEERGSMFNPYGIYGTQSPTTSIMFCYLVWLNYTSQQLEIYNTGGNLPYASVLFNRDPITLGFESQADHVWLGMSPLGLWGDPNGQYSGGAEGNTEMFFNITTFNVQIIPPNGPPRFNLDIDDQYFNEDEGPWVNLTDLDDHFSDPQPEHNAMLRYEVIDVDADPGIEFMISVDGMLSVRSKEDNFNGYGDYKIKCFDWGPDWLYDSNDDLSVVSNTFTVSIAPVNDDAYIEKVDIQAGTVKNKHEPIHITIPQGFSGLKAKKIFAYDNDTEDQGRLKYEHNGTTASFIINENGQYSFTPTNDDVGVHWIKVTVDDGHSPDEDDYVIFVFHVTNRNDRPDLVSIEWRHMGIVYDNLDVEDEPTFRNVEEDIEINLTIEAYDADIDIGIPDSLQWTLGSPGWEIHPHPSSTMKAYLTYTPTNDDAIAGQASTTVQVMDSQNANSQEITVVLFVDNMNDKPILISINTEFPVDGKISLTEENEHNGFEDRMFVLTVVAEEVDPRDDITFSVNDPSWQQTPVLGNELARNFTILPTQEMIGTHTVRITVSDEDGAADTVLVTYQIVGTNDAPNRPTIKYDYSLVLYTENELSFWILDGGEDLDPDGDELEFVWDFGDGSEKVRGDQVTHVYTVAKSYTITVYAEDPSGAISEDVMTYITTIDEPVVIDPNLDTDGDGMPDVYEEDNGLDKNNGNDKYQDRDEDGFTNFEEFEAGTNPLDPKSHPDVTSSDEEGFGAIIWILIAFFVILVLGAIGFFIFVVMAKPKQVQQQQMYGAELPGALAPQLPQQPQQQLPGPETPQLPPVKEEVKEPEEDLMESFMEDAQKELEESTKMSSEEDNIWRPPAPEEAPHEESHVDDLFSDEPEAAEQPKAEIPAPPKLPDLPPPPPI
ncbi:MAG: PKD domain-containing protein [Candidatus Thermoplasmatota archaeon]|nr:PKD domain-containing protein [Candidatus Thermoplasmatota archaeon]